MRQREKAVPPVIALPKSRSAPGTGVSPGPGAPLLANNHVVAVEIRDEGEFSGIVEQGIRRLAVRRHVEAEQDEQADVATVDGNPIRDARPER